MLCGLELSHFLRLFPQDIPVAWQSGCAEVHVVAWTRLGLLVWCKVLLPSPQEHLCVLPSPRPVGSFGAGTPDVGGPSGASGHKQGTSAACCGLGSQWALCVSEAAVCGPLESRCVHRIVSWHFGREAQ